MSKSMPRLACLLFLVLPIGCDSSSGTPDWVPDDLSSEATLDQIGDSGYGRLCTAFQDYVLDMYRDSYLVEAVCTAIAIETTETADACGDSVQSCKENPPQEATALLDMILAQAGCTAVGVQASGCGATVGQVTACLDDLGAAVDNVRFTLTCAAAGQMLDDSWWQVSPPASCTGLVEACQ